jgi:hypothetical protein
MKYFRIFCLMAIVGVGFCSHAHAQIDGIFTGKGMRSPEPPAATAPKLKWPKLLDFSKDESETPKTKPFSSLFAKKPVSEPPSSEKPGFDWLKKKPSVQQEQVQAKPKAGIADLFPKRDPDRPSMFEQMNMKSKSFIDRTTGWTQRKNQKMRDKSFSTWDSITKELRASQPELEQDTIPAQPPVRSADASNKPRVRF